MRRLFCSLCKRYHLPREYGCAHSESDTPAVPEALACGHERISGEAPGHCSRCDSAAVPEAPALPEGWELEITGHTRISFGLENTEWIKLSVLRALLATQGLSIIGAKERAVLEKAAALSRESLERFGPVYSMTPWCEFAGAELARREGK